MFKWAKMKSKAWPELDLMFAVPNAGQRDVRVGAKMKSEGLKAGVPDICLPVSRKGYGSLFIEMKAKGGSLQPSQKAWIAELQKHGNKAEVCYGFEEAIEVISEYLN